MKLHILSFLLLLIAAGANWSCKKQLDVFPTTQEVDGNIIVDAKSAGTTLNGVYYLFAASAPDNNGVLSTKWVDSHEGLPSELSGLMDYAYGGSAEAVHSYKADAYEIGPLWSYGYAIINAANGFLKNIAPVKTINDSTKKEMIAEAKFLRAYANSYLLLNFGQYSDVSSAYGIVLRNEFVSTTNLDLPRASVQTCYDSILADLGAAIAWLPNTNTTNAYANVWAAKLLEARLLMNRGSAADYATVISLTNDLMTNSPFSLEANSKDIFRTKGLSSNEVIMGIQPFVSPQQAYKFDEYLYYNQYILTDTTITWFQNDPRRSWTLFVKDLGNGFGAQGFFTKYYPGDTVNLKPAPISEFSYVFRLTEAYLLNAEALVASGGDLNAARTLLKTVMGHAGFTDFSDEDAATTAPALQALIIREEMKNFLGEDGQDWLAARRLPFADLQSMLPTVISPTLLILPIPQAEILANPLVKQNPGY